MNVRGVTGLLVLPLAAAMALPALAASAAGYATESVAVKYVTLAVFAMISIVAYVWLINGQGSDLARREQEILEAVTADED
jgi:hypothetical protein